MVLSFNAISIFVSLSSWAIRLIVGKRCLNDRAILPPIRPSPSMPIDDSLNKSKVSTYYEYLIFNLGHWVGAQKFNLSDTVFIVYRKALELLDLLNGLQNL